MDIALEPAPDAATTEAVRVSAAAAGLERGSSRADSAWWHAGVADAVDRAVRSAPAPAGRSRYDAARSPRSTRGATRA